jgi:cell division protein FtsB
MIKIISSIAATALTVGGAGYSYVTKVQTQLEETRKENVELKTDNANKAQRIKGTDMVLDEIIRKAQLAKSDSGG